MYKRTSMFLFVGIVVLSMLLSACGDNPPTATAIPKPTATKPPPTDTVPPATPTTASTPTPAAKTPEQIVKDLRPATVWVKSTFGETAIEPEGIGAGTGIVYDLKNGYILTNAHVVEGASAIQIYQANSTRGRPARVLGRAECDDLAVLKVDDTTGLAEAPLGDSSALEPGSSVVALGYPLAFDLGNDLTVSKGIVSKLHEQLDEYNDLIQTDASITHGNSGGPLVNEKGEVVGVNSLGYEQAPGINFAIAISYAKPIIKDLEAGKNRNYLGLNLVPNITDYKQYFGTDDGMVVVGVASGSPADQADIEPTDLLLKIEGQSITYGDQSASRTKQVCDILRSHADGDPLKIVVQRLQPAQYMQGEVAIGKGGAGTSKLASIGPVDNGGNGNNNGNNGNNGGQETPTASGGSGDNLAIVVDTKFSSGDTGTWPLDKGDGYTEKVANGLYTIALTKSDLSVTSTPKEAAGMTDGVVSASAKAVGDGWVGIVARYAYANNDSSMYFCGVSADSQFFCSKRAGGQWTNLADTSSDSVIKANDFNVLTLAVSGNKINFIVNDKTIGSYTDSSLSSGAFGVLASTTSDSTSFSAQYEEVLIAKPK